MKNTKMSNVLTTIILALLLSFSTVLAQYDNTEENTNTQNQGNQQDKTGTSTDNMMGNDQGEEAFRQTAMQLANDLISRVNLQQDKSEEIADIILDYRNNIADIKHQNKSNPIGMTGTDNATGTGTTGENPDMEGTDQTDQTGTGDQTGVEGSDNEGMVGGTEGSNVQEAYREADMEANEKIENAIGEESIQQYLSVKREWWSDVKDKVHASLNASGWMEHQMDNQGTGSGTGTDDGTETDDATGTENR